MPAACNCFCTYIISGSAFFNCCSKRAGERVYIAAFARINDESAQSCITKLAVRLVHGPPLAMVGVIGVSVVGGDSGRAITTAGFGGGFAGSAAQAARSAQAASVRRRMPVRAVLMRGSDPWPA